MSKTPRFVQVHFLTTYPASLLNRDDAGFAKRLPFGSDVRTRISSQCLKRHWRLFEGNHSLAGIRGPESMSVRSRYIFERIARGLCQKGFEEEAVNRTVSEIRDVVLGASEKGTARGGATKDAEGTASDETVSAQGMRTSQVIVLGKPEVDYIAKLAEQALASTKGKADKSMVKQMLGKDGMKNLRAVGRGAGLDAALFGRMKTSDVLADCDAAVHVAHAFTVHREQTETDYFTAADDLVREMDEEAGAGAGHVNASELTTGLYYGYVAVDVPLLVSNLEGVAQADWQTADVKLSAEVLKHLVHLVATVSPGAKRGATAPYSYADLMVVEVGDSQPCTWANAFFNAVRPGDGMATRVLTALANHVAAIDRIYAPGNQRSHICMYEPGLPDAISKDATSLSGLTDWTENQLKGVQP